MHKARNYKLVLFDYDGCLVDSMGVWTRVMRETALEFGVTLTPAHVREQIGDFLRASDHGIPVEKVEEYRRRVILRGKEEAIDAPIYEGAVELLAGIKSRGKKLGIVSGNQSGIRFNLERNQLITYFDLVVTGEDVKKMKPDPEGIEYAIREFRAKKKETIMIGDSIHDIVAANNAEIASVLYYPSHHSEYHDVDEILLRKPTHVVASHSELGRVLLR